MSATAAGLLQLVILLVALAVVYRPLGDYMARVFTSTRHLAVERAFYRVVRVDPDADQRWTTYLFSVLGFSAASVLFLYAFLRLQDRLPLSLGMDGVDPALAWNTAVSFVANTNWQAYAGESTMGHLAQMAGLAVQNFVSAAAGLAVAIAVIRGLVRTRTDRLGNFWVDLTRGVVRILLPLAFVFALVLVAGGVIQNLSSPEEITTLTGGTQSIVGGPGASQEVIKELGTNGGGFFNANSAHPFENPNAFTNLVEIFLILVIPVSLTRTYGVLVKDRRQGYAILAAMAVLWGVALAGVTAAEVSHPGTVPEAVGATTEGKEVRFDTWASALFATSTTGTSTGAVNSMHASYTGAGGGIVMLNMMLGEVSPGGVGSGLYGMLVLAILAVFLAGLMVGRTPEYLGKKIGRHEITLVALYLLAMPFALLVGAAIAASFDDTRASLLNDGPQGLSEILYAFASGANNNGSAFAGLSANTDYYNTALGLAMLIGRFVLMALVLALAGSLARQTPTPVTAGTLPTHRPLFVGLHSFTVIVVAGLTFFPALALGPIAVALA
ncbi:potassium-transporting ATPase subunit KdpA [Jiangella rhizosphaerae]|uniref:Potassium-transporting ATPase potassium-binding subunit n=1 Tax=Jiangella rhizosphaerae TaxID=2293569 RepID=A0A418KVG7_9ACTN|nr:potassium-transporting ATPase subunit KdpA [Jiangella rhizosphaerae]RIQ34035.1 potassium-transporting ATPase subunit KdpA [Jiangella rhizosphaerae]